MNTAKLVKWGNSVGIRLPAKELEAANIPVGTVFKISRTKAGGITLTPIHNPQAGWLEAFNAVAEKSDDKWLLDETMNDFDKDEWTW